MSNGPAVAKEFAATQTKLAKQADTFKALIIKENRVPANGYVGQDRDDIIKVAKRSLRAQVIHRSFDATPTSSAASDLQTKPHLFCTACTGLQQGPTLQSV